MCGFQGAARAHGLPEGLPPVDGGPCGVSVAPLFHKETPRIAVRGVSDQPGGSDAQPNALAAFWL